MLEDEEPEQPTEEPIWVPLEYVVKIHENQIEKYGGSPGVRDEGLLDSALKRPNHYWCYCSSDIFQLAAVYAWGLARNHPFNDGKKRTAFVTALVFLRFNGYCLEVQDQSQIVEMMVRAVTGDISERELAIWFEKYSLPLEDD